MTGAVAAATATDLAIANTFRYSDAILAAALNEMVEVEMVEDDEITDDDETELYDPANRRHFREPDRKKLVTAIGPGAVMCMWCGYEVLDARPDMDHVAHRAAGGPTVVSNATLMHAHCNGDKGSLPFQCSPLHELMRTGKPLPKPWPRLVAPLLLTIVPWEEQLQLQQQKQQQQQQQQQQQ
jgi:hypothetical protein